MVCVIARFGYTGLWQGAAGGVYHGPFTPWRAECLPPMN